MAPGGFTSLSSGGGGGGAGGEGGGRAPAPFAERATFGGIRDAELGKNGAPDYVEVYALINFIRNESIAYAACRTEKCNKKMQQNPGQDSWSCEKCGNTYDSPEYRYVLSLSLSDWSGATFVTAFNKEGAIILGGRAANDVEQLRVTNPHDFQALLLACTFQTGIFRLKLKEETYGEQNTQRVKAQIMDVRLTTDFVHENRELVGGIKALLARP